MNAWNPEKNLHVSSLGRHTLCFFTTTYSNTSFLFHEEPNKIHLGGFLSFIKGPVCKISGQKSFLWCIVACKLCFCFFRRSGSSTEESAMLTTTDKANYFFEFCVHFRFSYMLGKHLGSFIRKL